MLDFLAQELSVPRPGGIRFWGKIAKSYFLVCGSRKALICIRLGQHFDRKGWTWMARRMGLSLRREFACYVNFKCEIGPGLRLPHPVGIVIGEGVRIGAGATIYQQVTLGGQRIGDWKAGRYPIVGDQVVMFAGAKLVGPLSVGDRAVIGANAVVVRDVPADHVAVGIPAIARPARRAKTPAATMPEDDQSPLPLVG